MHNQEPDINETSQEHHQQINKYEIKDKLKKRFCLLKSSGGKNYYYDIESDESNISAAQIICLAIYEWGIGIEEAKKIVSHCNFISVHESKRYFRPGERKIICIKGIYYINTWRPSDWSEVEPTFNVSPFVEFLEKATSEENAEFIIKQLALAYQYPHPLNKPQIAMYLYSSEQGQGKSTFSDIIKEVFGETSHKVINTHKPLFDKNAIQFWGQTWLVCEEAKIERSDNLYDQLKQYITASYLTDSVKFGSPQKFETPARLIMLSNRAPSFIEKDDRRFFISEWDTGLRGDERNNYFNEFRRWLNSGGFQSIASYLCSIDVSDYDFAAPAPLNKDKMMVINTFADPLVEKFLDIIEEEDIMVFDESNFNIRYFLEENNIKQTHARHIFNEAGFVKYDRKISFGKDTRFRPWYPKTAKMLVTHGKPAEIRLENGETYFVKDVYNTKKNGSNYF